MIDANITGDAEVVRSFGATDANIRAALVRAMGRIVLRLQTRVKAGKLSGQVLNVRTGRLRRSITRAVEDEGGVITGIVGTNVEYAKYHEYGTERRGVKQSLRDAKRKAGRGALKASKAKAGKAKASGGLPERSFLRSALRDLKESGVIDREIAAAVAEAAKKL